MRRAKCDGCGEPLGDARMQVNAANLSHPQGWFHTWGCYTKALEASKLDSQIDQLRKIHADAEVIVGVE